MTLGEFIKQYRNKHDLSIRAFANMAGMSTQQISNIEKGIGNNGKPMTSTMKTYRLIAEAVGMSEQDFMNLLNDNVLVNPADFHLENEKIPITKIDGHLLLDLSLLNEDQKQAIITVLQTDPKFYPGALSEIESLLSDQPTQDDSQ